MVHLRDGQDKLFELQKKRSYFYMNDPTRDFGLSGIERYFEKDISKRSNTTCILRLRRSIMDLHSYKKEK